MSRDIGQELEDHFGSNVTTLAECWRIQRRDGEVFAFTNHDVNITINGEIYVGCGLKSMSAYELSSDASVSNMNVDVLLESDDISEIDVETGLFDSAIVDIFMVNYSDLSQGKLRVMHGELGEVEIKDDMAAVELRSLAQRLQQNMGRMHTNRCDAELGDSRCGVDLDSYAISGEVDLVVDRGKFADISLSGETEDYFRYGSLTFDSGLNAGRSIEIKGFATDLPIMSVGSYNFGLSGHQMNHFSIGDVFDVINSSGNNGTYTVASVEYDKKLGYAIDVLGNEDKHKIELTWKGGIEVEGTQLADDVQEKIDNNEDMNDYSGKNFRIEGSPHNDGEYEVREVSKNTDNGTTEITTIRKLDVPREVGRTYVYTEESVPSSTADGSVRYDEPGMFRTFLPFPFKIECGDTFRVFPGCDKFKTTCRDKFSNIVNFRGFDFIPGRDALSKVGGR